MGDDAEAPQSAFVFISYGKALRASLRRQLSSLHPVLHFWPSVQGVNLAVVAERVRNHFSATFGHLWELHLETGCHEWDATCACSRWVSRLARAKSRFVFWYADFHLHDAVRPDPGGHLFVDTTKCPCARPFGVAQLVSDVRQTRKPGVFVFDGPEAGGFYARWPAMPSDVAVVAFFASDVSAPLVPSLFVPLDAFSVCMLDPATAFVDWQRRRRRPGTRSPPLAGEMRANVTRLLTFGARAIARRVIGEQRYDELFERDPVIGSYCVAFVVASKILFDEAVHPVSVPEIPTTGHHHMWKLLEDGVDRMLDGSYQLFRRAHVEWFRASLGRKISDSEFLFPLAVIAADPRPSADAELLAAFRERSEDAVKLASLFGLAEPQIDAPEATASTV